MTPPDPARPRLLSPSHWPAWLGIGAIRLVALLPYPALYRFGRMLGWLTRWLPSERRAVAQRNLEICLPELDTPARTRLLRDALADLGLMLVEFAFAWMSSDAALDRVPCSVAGLEHLEACRRQGRGVLLVGAHFSHLELCARLVSRRLRISGMYRVMDNPVFEHSVLQARLRYAEAMYRKNELLGAVRYLRGGGTLWYAPDQDMRGKGSVFVPFFGVPAATITATHHLARLSGAAVIPFFHRRRPDGAGYELRLEAPLDAFPSGDAQTDTARVNAQIERMVREAPEQYLWVHKRFKSRPPGSPSLY